MVGIIYLIVAAFAIYMIRKEAVRREKMHEQRLERFSRLKNQLKKLNSEQNVQESDTTKDEEIS